MMKAFQRGHMRDQTGLKRIERSLRLVPLALPEKTAVVGFVTVDISSQIQGGFL